MVKWQGLLELWKIQWLKTCRDALKYSSSLLKVRRPNNNKNVVTHRSSHHSHHQRQKTFMPHIQKFGCYIKKRVKEPNADKPSCHTLAAIKTITTNANKPSCHTPVTPLREVKNPGGERSTNVQPPSPNMEEKEVWIYSSPSIKKRIREPNATVAPHRSNRQLSPPTPTNHPSCHTSVTPPREV